MEFWTGIMRTSFALRTVSVYRIDVTPEPRTRPHFKKCLSVAKLIQMQIKIV